MSEGCFGFSLHLITYFVDKVAVKGETLILSIYSNTCIFFRDFLKHTPSVMGALKTTR